MPGKATTVKQYLAELPPDRRAAIQAVRDVILDNLDEGIQEGMSYGMIGYYVPHSIYPAGYHCDPSKPLPYAGLASQKGHMSLYLMSVCTACEADEGGALARWFRDAWAKSGKKLDMGRACIRFKKLEDLPLDVIGEAFRRTPLNDYIAFYETSLRKAGRAPARAKAQKAARAAPAGRAKAARKTASAKSKVAKAAKRRKVER